MSLLTIGTAVVLGLSAAPGCLALCLPVMVPMITLDSDPTPRAGLRFAAVMALGRLGVYLPLALLAGAVGALVFEPGPALVPRVLGFAVGAAVLFYALMIVLGRTPAQTCPRALGARFRARTGRTEEPGRSALLVPALFGAMLSALVCPPFLLVLATALVSGGWLVALGAGLGFWVGTLPLHIATGALAGWFGWGWRQRVQARSWRSESGESRPRKTPQHVVTTVSALTLLLVGVWWCLTAVLS